MVLTIEQIIQGRLEFSKNYCEKKGWPTEPSALSFEQIMEIREQPEWINATSIPIVTEIKLNS